MKQGVIRKITRGRDDSGTGNSRKLISELERPQKYLFLLRLQSEFMAELRQN